MGLLLEQFRRIRESSETARNYAFEDTTLFASSRSILRFVRRLLNPILKLFFNPNPLIEALHIQSRLNTINAERESARHGIDQLYYELIHNLVLETTRAGIEIKNFGGEYLLAAERQQLLREQRRAVRCFTHFFDLRLQRLTRPQLAEHEFAIAADHGE